MEKGDLVHVDARDLCCPLPVLKAAKALRGMASGQRLEILVTDEAAPRTFRDFCAEGTAHLIDCARTDGGHRIVVEKA